MAGENLFFPERPNFAHLHPSLFSSPRFVRRLGGWHFRFEINLNYTFFLNFIVIILNSVKSVRLPLFTACCNPFLLETMTRAPEKEKNTSVLINYAVLHFAVSIIHYFFLVTQLTCIIFTMSIQYSSTRQPSAGQTTLNVLLLFSGFEKYWTPRTIRYRLRPQILVACPKWRIRKLLASLIFYDI